MATRTLQYIILGKDSLSPVVKKAGKEVEESNKGILGAFSKTGIAGVALAGIVGGYLLKAVKDARAEGWTPLKVAAQDAGIAFSAFKPKAEQAGAAMAKLGFSQADVNSSLKVLLTSTRNSQLSLKSLATAADLAKFKGVGLAQASQLLAKAATGSTKALKDVGISTADLPKHFSTTGTEASRMAIVMSLLNKRIGGEASAAANTFGGKLAAMHAQLENVSAKIGTALLPILSSLLGLISAKVLPIIQQFSDWFENVGSPAITKFANNLKPLTQAIAVDFFAGIKDVYEVLKFLGDEFLKLPGPIKIIALAVAGLTIAWYAFNAAVDANPIVAWGALILLVLGLVTSHWSQFVSFFKGAMRLVTQAAMDVWDWIKGHWVLLAAIIAGPIGLAAAEVISHWHDIQNAASVAFNAIVSWFRGLPGRISGAIGNMGNLLYGAGKDVIQGLWNGLTFVWQKVTGWISGLANWIKNHKGPISLDRTLLEPAGRALMEGLSVGLGKGFVKVKDIVSGAAGSIGSWIGGAASSVGNFFSSLFGGGGSGGSGVNRWASLVDLALAMNGLPKSLEGRVLYQMQTESGGNPNAINNTDINAQMGDPSRGLLQTIMSTFMAYHMAGTSMNIYDPLANIAAAINYAKHVYGPSLMSGGMGMGSGHGYWMGTNSASRGWHWVGERGPELMRFHGGEQVIPNNRAGGNVYQVTVNVRGALSTDRDISKAVVDGLSNFERHGGNVPWG